MITRSGCDTGLMETIDRFTDALHSAAPYDMLFRTSAMITEFTRIEDNTNFDLTRFSSQLLAVLCKS